MSVSVKRDGIFPEEIIPKMVDGKPVMHFCCQDGMKAPLLALWVATGTAAFMMMSHYEYTTKAVRDAQKKAAALDRDVEPKKSLDLSMVFLGLLVVAILGYFTYAIFRCPKYMLKPHSMKRRFAKVAGGAIAEGWRQLGDNALAIGQGIGRGAQNAWGWMRGAPARIPSPVPAPDAYNPQYMPTPNRYVGVAAPPAGKAAF